MDPCDVKELKPQNIMKVKAKLNVGEIWTAPTYTEVFLRGLQLFGKSRKGLLKSKKKIEVNHAFFLDN